VSGGLLRVRWLVDPGRGRELGRDGRLAHEPFRALGVGGVEDDGAGGVALLGVPVVDWRLEVFEATAVASEWRWRVPASK